MRLRARTDANQQKIVDTLRKAGASVVSTHQLGRGVPDILVGFKRCLFWLEIKNGSKVPSARKLTKPELFFHLLWRDYVKVVSSEEEALRAIGAI